MRLRYSPRLSGLALNPSLPADLLDLLIARGDVELCLDLAERDDLSPSQVATLASRGGTATTIRLIERGFLDAGSTDARDPDVRLAFLDRGPVPEDWLHALADDPDPSVRACLAAAAVVPVEVLAALAPDADLAVVAEVARSPRLTAELADTLARHPHMAVRRALASNVHAPPAILAALATSLPGRCFGCDGTADPPPGMECTGSHEGAMTDLRVALAANRTTPSRVAESFVDHPSSYVRWTVAERNDLELASYRRLADDPNPGVRGAVAQNPAIGEELIESMALDDTYDVRRRVAHNPAIPLDVLADIAGSAKIGATLLPRIAAATPDEMAALSRSPVAAVRMALAERTDLPLEVVSVLAEDRDAKVLKALAPNPTLTGAQLAAMVERHGARVAARVASNPTAGPELLHRLATLVPPVRRVFRAVAANHRASAATLALCLNDQRARPIAARHPALPIDEIVALIDDPRGRVAEAAAANPSLPRDVMRRLLTSDAAP